MVGKTIILCVCVYIYICVYIYMSVCIYIYISLSSENLKAFL